MHFLNPGALVYLWFVLSVALLLWLSYQRRQSLYLKYCDRHLLPKSAQPLSPKRFFVKAGCSCLCAAALVVAIARPCLDKNTSEFPHGKIDVVAMVDVSRSMAAVDYKDRLPSPAKEMRGTRLDMSKQLIESGLMSKLQGNQLGIVTYCGKAFPQAFLSNDISSLRWVVHNALKVTSAPGEGSSVARALALSLTYFELDSPADHDRLLVIFSDGGNDDSLEEIGKLAEVLRRNKIKVIVFGIGNVNPSPIPLKDLAEEDDVAKAQLHHGKQWYEENGEMVKTALDENLLRQLARLSGGTYRRISSAEDLDIVSLARSYAVSQKAGVEEIFFYPLLVGLIAFIGSILASRESSSAKRKSP
ncbi:MAG: VWA domain-containing protein [Candidatus Obscuribacterales bacterium]|nr:VWA domain-containing protein [Candidatus Obscuribacterales bacterium]